jgi:predicted O-methyltransferase YrrM
MRSPLDRHTFRVVARVAGATIVVGVLAELAVPRFASACAIACAAAAIAFELTRVRRALAERLDDLEADLAQTQPLLELARALPTRRPLPALRGFAIAPDTALWLVELLRRERPKLVVETGSGVSTLVIAYTLEQLGDGGRVIALDHDARYAAASRALVAAHGLSAIATVIDAALEPVEVRGGRHRWYATRALDDVGTIDLVFDDGPPRHVGDMLRYASLHVLAPKLATAGVFVLDVVGEEERRVLARWQAELPDWHHEHVATKKGNVVITKGRR